MVKTNKCYIFSYNRGIFLKNCITSVEKHLSDNFDITIIDDHSKDELTRKILEEYAKKYRVIQPLVEFKNYKVGNFYANMNYAFKDALQCNTRLVLFIEDDMQIVRKVSKEDIERIILFFSKTPNTIQLHTNFLKKCNLKYKKYLVIDQNSKNAYFRTEKHPLNSCYCSNGIFYMPRIPKLIGSLKDGLSANEIILKKKGCKLGFYAYPFMMWLPMPISFRKKENNFYHRIKEFIAGCGYHPYDEMSTAFQNKLFSRPLDEFPYAEDYLQNSHCGHIKQWSFTGMNYAFKELGGWRIIFLKLFNFIDFKIIPKLKNIKKSIFYFL